MKSSIAFLIFSFLFLVGFKKKDSEFTYEKYCDIPGNNISSLSKTTKEICKKNCDSDSQCKGFTYISGWRKCFLKKKVSKSFRIRFYSGEKDKSGKIVNAKYDHDNSGKDIKRLANIDEKSKCLKACEDSGSCGAFTYIEGYRDCWLKKGGGRNYEKIFYCGKS